MKGMTMTTRGMTMTERLVSISRIFSVVIYTCSQGGRIMASKARNAQVEETPSERFERIFKRAVERHRRADARRAEKERKAKVVASGQSR